MIEPCRLGDRLPWLDDSSLASRIVVSSLANRVVVGVGQASSISD
jgi:hypothetical protein